MDYQVFRGTEPELIAKDFLAEAAKGRWQVVAPKDEHWWLESVLYNIPNLEGNPYNVTFIEPFLPSINSWLQANFPRPIAIFDIDRCIPQLTKNKLAGVSQFDWPMA